MIAAATKSSTIADYVAYCVLGRVRRLDDAPAASSGLPDAMYIVVAIDRGCPDRMPSTPQRTEQLRQAINAGAGIGRDRGLRAVRHSHVRSYRAGILQRFCGGLPQRPGANGIRDDVVPMSRQRPSSPSPS